MDMVTIRVSNTMSVNLPGVAEPVEWDWAKVPEENRQAIGEYLLNFALRQSSGDAGAGEKDAEKKGALVRAKFDKIQSGEVPAGGGGGPRLDPVKRAWIAYFVAMKTKVSGIGVSGKNLADAQRTACRQAILAMEPEAKARIKEEVETRLDGWLAWMEANNPALQAMIAAEKAKELPAKPFVAPKGAF